MQIYKLVPEPEYLSTLTFNSALFVMVNIGVCDVFPPQHGGRCSSVVVSVSVPCTIQGRNSLFKYFRDSNSQMISPLL